MPPDLDPEKVPEQRDSPDEHDDLSVHSHSTKDEEDEIAQAPPILGEPTGILEEKPCSRRASSTRSRPLSVIPRSKRRGLFGRFTLIPEVENAYTYKRSTKWMITFVIALATAAAPLGSSIFYRKSRVL